MLKKQLSGKPVLRTEEESVNPMDGMANLADVMLILAVGIMLALVMHWNVDIGAMTRTDTTARDDAVDTEDALSFEPEDMERLENDAEEIEGGSMEKLGAVYFDEATGKYYIIDDEE